MTLRHVLLSLALLVKQGPSLPCPLVQWLASVVQGLHKSSIKEVPGCPSTRWLGSKHLDKVCPCEWGG